MTTKQKVHKINSTKAMKAAWTNSKKAARKHGGRAAQYFRLCLIKAWAWVKKTAAEAAEIRAAREEMIELAAPVWESDKAFGYDAWAECFVTHASRKVRVFLPKSMINNNAAPWWLLKKKVDEIKDSLGRTFGIESGLTKEVVWLD